MIMHSTGPKDAAFKLFQKELNLSIPGRNLPSSRLPRTNNFTILEVALLLKREEAMPRFVGGVFVPCGVFGFCRSPCCFIALIGTCMDK